MDFPITKIENVEGLKYGDYNTRPTDINFSSSKQFGGALNIYQCTAVGSNCVGRPSHDAHILHLNWDAANGHDGQIALATNSDIMCFRRQTSKTEWSDWKKLAINGALSMPSETNKISISCSVTANSASWSTVFEYVAPADGYVVVYVNSGTQTGRCAVRLSGGGLGNIAISDNSTSDPRSFIPVAKGETIKCECVNIAKVSYAAFLYAQSEV